MTVETDSPDRPKKLLAGFLATIQAPLQGHWLIIARILWATVTLLTLSLFITAVPVRFSYWMTRALNYKLILNQLGLSPSFLALYFLLPECLTFLILGGTGIFIFWQKSDDWMVILFSLMLVTLGSVFTPLLNSIMEQHPLAMHLVLIVQGTGIMLSLLFFYLFPDGHFVPRFTRFLAGLWGIWIISWSVFPHSPLSPLNKNYFLIYFTATVAYSSALLSQFYRYFQVLTTEQQKKSRWVIFGIAGALAFWLGLHVTNAIAAYTLSANIYALYSMIIIPPLTYFPPFLIFFAIAISIFRYRLWNVDLLIHQGLVYSTLTALLGGLYFLIVFLLTLVIRAFFSEANSTLVVFAATLATTLTITPLRRRIQALIDRALYRSKVDYQKVIQEVSADLASSIDLDDLAILLTATVPQSLQISKASLYIVSEKDQCVKPARYEDTACYLPLLHPLVKYLRRHNKPISYINPPPDMRQTVLTFLESQQIIVCVPLISAGELVGLYNLGEKLSGGLYSRQERHMLHMLGQQSAISMQNARLYRQTRRYNERLEEQVAARTQELATAYRILESQNTRLDGILHNVADALVVTDLEGKITLVNPAFEALIERPNSQVVGQALSEVFPDHTLSAAVQAAYESSPTIVTVDATWQQHIYRASACALVKEMAAGSEAGVVTILHDITHEVEVAQMKDEFVSMVSHELRTPMTSVIGFSKLIQKQFSRTIKPCLVTDEKKVQRAATRIEDNLNIIVSEGDRLTRLVNDILDVAKMEAQHIEWHMQEIRLPAVLKASINAMESLARQKRLPIKLDLPEDLPAIYADHDRLVQITTNLLSNALKFTDNGEICVRVWNLAAGEDIPAWAARYPKNGGDLPAAQQMLVICVEDTGIGIAAADLPKVFEKFRRVEKKDYSQRRPGTGLGLVISRQIVERHQGRIWVESREGQGSRFMFTLPLHQTDPE